MRHLNIRIAVYIGISPLTRKQVEPKNSSVVDYLLLCNHSTSHGDISILEHDNQKLLLELKESLLIIRKKTSLNRNITLAPLYLYLTEASKKFLEFIYLLEFISFNSCYVILIQFTFFVLSCIIV